MSLYNFMLSTALSLLFCHEKIGPAARIVELVMMTHDAIKAN